MNATTNNVVRQGTQYAKSFNSMLYEPTGTCGTLYQYQDQIMNNQPILKHDYISEFLIRTPRSFQRESNKFHSVRPAAKHH
jgi:hypothetical protein